MSIIVFWFQVQWNMFPMVQLTISQRLVQVIAWRRTGDKPSSEPVMTYLPTGIWVTRPQGVKNWWHNHNKMKHNITLWIFIVYCDLHISLVGATPWPVVSTYGHWLHCIYWRKYKVCINFQIMTIITIVFFNALLINCCPVAVSRLPQQCMFSLTLWSNRNESMSKVQ